MAPAASAQPPARPDSPPYVTSEMHQSMETYQRNFWQRQMARVEEQVSLPEDQAAAVAHARRDDGGEEDDNEGDDDADETPMTDAALAASAKELMELFKPQAGQLPLARIKKVMKASDDDVKMISAEAPILFARACEIFIADLTCRSYMHATAHRRRTVQRSDVVAAVAGSNVFDFLVDIVPRGQEDAAAATSTGKASAGGSASTSRARKASEEGEPEAEA